MNTYSTSDGERLSTKQIDARIKKAKAEKLEEFMSEYGFVFCEDCGISSGTRFDMSHNVSVYEAKKSGMAELCWDVANIKIRCRACHRKHDKNE